MTIEIGSNIKSKELASAETVGQPRQGFIPVDYLDNGLIDGEAVVRAHQEVVIWKRANS